METEITHGLRINERSRTWCMLPYQGHPKGCPNFGKKTTCPPMAPMVWDFVDIRRSLWLVVVEFNIARHMDRMFLKHPAWSQRQARCVLYWQNRVNADLRLRASTFVQEHPGTIYSLCPEAMGVNVIATAQREGVPIRVKPQSIVYKIALVGYPCK